MADQVTYQGRLIAVDGSRGKAVTRAAAAVVAELKAAGIECAVSRWDASGLFGELAGGRGDRTISPRTLSLVYAADLAFRLRWEIGPVLQAGGVVIAAPYIETAVAFGSNCNLDERWLRELLRFAPVAHWRGLTLEKKLSNPWKRRLDRGYLEYCAAMLDASEPGCVAKAARRRTVAKLDQARGRRIYALSDAGVAALTTAVTGSRRDAPSRRSSPPRNGRK